MKLFVTGTDTGVGKTFVTAAIARELVRQGQTVFAWKPIETGCHDVAGHMVGDDAEALAIAAGNWQTGVQRGMFLLRDPVAPVVAAASERRTIEVPAIIDLAHQCQLQNILVEGAGGIRVPITLDTDMAQFARACGFPVVIVARASLGTINHSVLTVEAARREGLIVAGVVLSKLPDVHHATAESNRQQIARIANVPVYVFDGSDSGALLEFLSKP